MLRKHLIALFTLLQIFSVSSMLTACSDDEDNNSSSPTTGNDNANRTALAELRRLEVPHLHEGTDTVLIHKLSDGTVNYIVEWDYQKKSQRWSAYALYKDLLAQNTTRYEGNPQYPQDPLLAEWMDWPSDPFSGNGQGIDHGHICPSADRLSSREANYQTFYLTNMMPQYHAFNAGVWAKMEAKVRTIATLSDTLYVCKGGTIDGGRYGSYNMVYRTLDNGLLVPRYYYMALLRKSGGQYSALGLWIDQVSNGSDSGKTLSQYAVSIAELERRTNIDFFCNLPDVTEQVVEASYGTLSAWSIQ